MLNAVPYHVKLQSLVFVQLKVLRSAHRAFTRLLEYCYYRLVSARLERHQHEKFHARRLFSDLRTLMKMFDGTSPIFILHFLSTFVEECNLEQISKRQVCLINPMPYELS